VPYPYDGKLQEGHDESCPYKLARIARRS